MPALLAPVDCGNPLNWRHPLARGLTRRWQAVPGLAGGAKLHNLAALPGDLSQGNHALLTGNGGAATTNQWSGTDRPGGLGEVRYTLASALKADLGVLPELNTSAFTVALWFRLDSLTGGRQPLFGRSGQNNSRFACIDWRNAAKLTVGEENVSFIADAGTTFAANVWYHFVWTYRLDNTLGAHNLYTNGRPDGSNAVYNLNSTFALNSWVSNDVTVALGGSADAVSMWNRALSSAEVLDLYNLDAAGAPGLLNRVGSRRPLGATAASLSRRTLYGRAGARGIA